MVAKYKPRSTSYPGWWLWALIGAGLALGVVVWSWRASLPPAPTVAPASLHQPSLAARSAAAPAVARTAANLAGLPSSVAESATEPVADGSFVAGADPAEPAAVATDDLGPAPPAAPPPVFRRGHFAAIPVADGYQVTFELGDYDIEQVRHGRQFYSRPQAAGASARLHVRGRPDLPVFRTDLAIPGGAEIAIEVVPLAFHDLVVEQPLPSLGFFTRDSFETAEREAFALARQLPPVFPEAIAVATDIYQIRQHTGIGILVQPFQYLAASRTLRVFDRVEVRIHLLDPPGVRPLMVDSPPAVAEFDAAVRQRFLNTAERRGEDAGELPEAPTEATGASRGRTAIVDHAALLVVLPDAWVGQIDDFVRWKRQRGLRVEVARYPADTGGGNSNLKAYIKNAYQSYGMSHLILMGDSGDIPVAHSSPPSDTYYTRLSTVDDYYHDAFVSRISAQNVDQLRNQIQKLLDYERFPDRSGNNGWYRKGMVVASGEGASKSAFKLADRDILAAERGKLLAGGYTLVNEIYDPYLPTRPTTAETAALRAQTIDGWNNGRSIILYLGHGENTRWVTTGFTVDHAKALVNGQALPFVFNANCNNGNFTLSYDCLSEAMIKVGSAGNPAGAIGVVAATSLADWDPPIVVTRSFTSMLVEAGNASAGAMTFFAVQDGIDYCYATSGEGATAAIKLMAQTHLFGDCTLGLRTTTPKALTVTHTPIVAPNLDFAVTIKDGAGAPLAGAVVCLYDDESGHQLVGASDADGVALLAVGDLPVRGPEATYMLTVYHRNAVPFQQEVSQLPDGLQIYSSAVLPPAFVGEAYSFQALAVGGLPPYEWQLAEGAPAWLAIDPTTGVLSGIAEAAGQLAFGLSVSDAEQQLAGQTLSLLAGVPVAIADLPLPAGMVGVGYNSQVQIAGTFLPITVAKTAGSLPPGLELSSNGALRGTPSVAGVYAFTLTATDQQQRQSVQAFEMQVAPSPYLLVTTPTPLANAILGAAYSVELTAAGGTGAGFQWSFGEGEPPPGLSLSPAGLLAGIPEVADTFLFVVQVVDDGLPPQIGSQWLQLTVGAPVRFDTAPLPVAHHTIPYAAQLEAVGSFPPFVFSALNTGPGYAHTESASSFDWSAGGTPQWVGDEQEWTLEFGFDFPFFGNRYSQARVGDNGYLIFGATSPANKWDATAANLAQHVMVAPFWNDLVASPNYPGTGVFVTAASDRVVIRWCGRDFHNQNDVVNVALTLHANGRLDFHYGGIQTTNRVVVGISNGTAASAQVLFTHAWNASNPQYVVGWDHRPDRVWIWQAGLPDWLALDADGTLHGTPPAPGLFAFTLQVADQLGFVDIREFSLDVRSANPADRNGDGDVDSHELLAFIDQHVAGQVARPAVEAAIAAWQTPASPARQTSPLAAAAEPQAVVRRGEIKIVEIAAITPAWRDELIRRGFDVAGLAGDRLLVYATAAEVEALVALGLAPVQIGSQWVGEAGERGESRVPSGYPTLAEVHLWLQEAAATYPHLCSLQSYGQSVRGEPLWALKISDNPTLAEDEAKVLIAATHHGDETVGLDLCLRLAELLLNNYGSATGDGARLTELVDSTELWIVPLLNPDGYHSQTRYNANGVDLNRDFPDGFVGTIDLPYPERVVATAGRQPETAAFMDWCRQQSFSTALTLHGGALVVAYPYGSNSDGSSTYTATPDDSTFQRLASLYASHNPPMLANPLHPGGIVNSAAWYFATGELADWLYHYMGTLAATGEVSQTKAPASSSLDGFWDDNREALLAFIEASSQGVRGRVTCAATGQPLYAKIETAGLDRPVYTTPAVGDFTRLLEPGRHQLTIAAPGYRAATLADVLVEAGRQTRLDLALAPSATSVQLVWPTSGYLADHEATLRLEIAMDIDDPPNAMVIVLSLPEAVDLVEAFWLGEGNGELAIPIRREGTTVSLLIWEGPFAGTGSLAVRLRLPAAARGDMTIVGTVQTSQWGIPLEVPGQWPLASETETINLPLVPGWNLFSTPLVLPDPQAAAVLAGIAFADLYRWADNRFQPASEIHPGQAYWLRCLENATLTLSGYPDPDSIRKLPAGWSCHGVFAELLATELGSTLAAWSWRPAAASYQWPATCTPGAAYWLHLGASTAIDFRRGR